MLRKSIVFILLVALGSIAAFAQQPEAKEKAERDAARTFELYFGGAGGSYLGVQTKDVSKENMAQFGLSKVQGVAIEKVLDNSPASQAGLMNGDVIIKFNGEEVTSVQKLTRLIREVAPDHTAKIVVLRNGDKRDFDVTIGKREMPKFSEGNFKFEGMPPLSEMPVIPEMPELKVFPPGEPGEPNVYFLRSGMGRQIGVGVTPLTKQLGEYFGVSDGEGLLIKDVREDSPAAKAGLRAGDVIVEVEGKKVNGNLDLIRSINEKKEGDVNLTIIRDRNRQNISVTPEKSKDGLLKFDGEMEKFFEREPGQMKLRMKTPKPPVSPPAPALFRVGGSRIL
jgi:membrane-associated protease RseP (regulator of RpoE activity)